MSLAILTPRPGSFSAVLAKGSFPFMFVFHGGMMSSCLSDLNISMFSILARPCSSVSPIAFEISTDVVPTVTWRIVSPMAGSK
ncbi:hypothetical protein R80B4_02446 [Fibrobacteres bacterium R8-0-B4]